MRKLDKTETLVTIGDMKYVREVTKLTCLVVCVYISSWTQFAYFLSLFELVNLLSKPPQCFQDIDFAATCVCRTRYSYAGAGYTFYPVSYLTLVYIDYFYR